MPRKLVERSGLTARENLDPATREIPHEPAEAERPRVARHEPAISDPLHASAYEEPPDHAASRLRLRTISITIGRTDRPMIARITSVKFSCTAGMFPKK